MATQSHPPVVRINECLITGKTQPADACYPRAIDLFYSIPYASVTRFERSTVLAPRTLDASKPGKTQPTFMAPDADAEGTLTLSVIRPSGLDEGKLLPVVVYVHGGGFNFGEPLERNLASFVAYGKGDVIVVAVSYRLGALGFLAGGDGQEELNLGLRDQRVAVEWIREWIGGFGGDKDDVTLMGVSAGAHSIGHHILHPDKIRFRKAILESGSATARSVLSAQHPRTKSQCQTLKSNAAARGGKNMKDMPIAGLLEAAIMVWVDNADAVTWPFQPVVDSSSSESLIPETPLKLWDAFSENNSKHISVITGFCSHEGTSFVPAKASANAQFREFFNTLIPGFTAADLDGLESLYPDPVTNPDSPYHNKPGYEQGKYGKQFRRLHSAYAHYAYICPILHTANKLSQMKEAAAATGQDVQIHVYVYEFAALGDAFHAASHGEQTPVVAHDADFLQGMPGLMATAREMNSRWTAFAASREGVLSADVWPEFETPFETAAGGGGAGVGKILVFGDGNDEAVDGGEGSYGTPVKERVLTESELERCRFWWERMGLSEGMCDVRKWL